jgi:putative aldouronate transport system permease protein
MAIRITFGTLPARERPVYFLILSRKSNLFLYKNCESVYHKGAKAQMLRNLARNLCSRQEVGRRMQSQIQNKKRRYSLLSLKRFMPLYMLFIPVALYYLIFAYAPMGGVIIAFKKYSFHAGIFGSPWAGFANFERFLSSSSFWAVISNTFRLALMRIIIGFPLPIILSVSLNELRSPKYKRTIQTLVYLPHFLSWIIVFGFVYSFFSSTGVVNQIVKASGGSAIPFMASKQYYDALFVGSALWKEVGWSAIIYLAALSSVSSELLEAAEIDGAGRFRKIWSVILPAIRNVIAIQLILNFGGILSVSFEQTLAMINDAVRPVAEVIDYYVYRMGILTANNYSYATAVGLFRNLIALFIVLLANRLVSAVEEDGALW